MSVSTLLDFSETVKKLLESISALKSQLTIVIVANVKGVTATSDYGKHSVITDFFSEEELEQVIVAYRDFGFYTHVFTDELDFMKSVSNGTFNEIPGKKKIIYNTAQKGIGAARHSLVPAFCKAYDIPYIGSNAYVSCLCRHKYHFNKLLGRYHEHVPQSWLFDYNLGWLLDQKPPEGLKVIAKPVYEAASIGISEASVFEYSSGKDEFLIFQSKEFCQPLAVEQFIDGYEVEVPIIISGQTYSLGPVGISLNGQKELGGNILSYDGVYNDNYSFYEFSEIKPAITKAILACTTNSSSILGIEDFGRIDFRVSSDGEFYLTDITTGPHTTKHSSCNHIFIKHGFSHSDLLTTLAACAAQRLSWFI